MTVPRCGAPAQVVEPMLTDQWFVAMSKPGRGTAGQSIAGGDRRGRRAAR